MLLRFQEELQDAGFQEIQIKQYLEPLNKFVKQEEIVANLSQAFEVDYVNLDTNLLAKKWQAMNLPFLPDSFG